MKSREDLRKYLRQYHRHDCPSRYYQAWKVLILETDEYRTIYDNEEQIIQCALKTLTEES